MVTWFGEKFEWLKKIFLTPGALFGYVTVGGLALVIVGYFLGTPPASPPPAWWILPWWADLLGKIGGLVIVGGVVGGVSRYLGAIGVFQEALAKVVTEDAYLDKLQNLDDLWYRLTQKIYLKGFKAETSEGQAFIDKAQEAIKKSIIFEDKFFARNVHVRYTISPTELIPETVKVEKSATYTVVSFEGPKPVPHHSKVIGVSGKSMDMYNEQETHFAVDGNDKVVREVKEVDNVITRTVTLKGKDSYYIERVTEFNLPLSIDPLIHSAAPYVIHGLTVVVECEAPGFSTHFTEIGMTDTFEDLLRMNKTQKERGNQSRRYIGVLLPEQGFILTIQPRKADSS